MNSNSRNWTDFSGADEQKPYALIPKDTLVKVILKIKPGGFDNADCGWTGGWATQNPKTGAVYLNCEFTVVSGQYAKRKAWGLIGLHSPKSDCWSNMGRSFIKAILCSAHAVSPKDNSSKAQHVLQIEHFGALEGLVFLARIDIETKPDGSDKNVIKVAITPDNKEYAIYMNGKSQPTTISPPTINNATLTGTADVSPPWAQ